MHRSLPGKYLPGYCGRRASTCGREALVQRGAPRARRSKQLKALRPGDTFWRLRPRPEKPADAPTTRPLPPLSPLNSITSAPITRERHLNRRMRNVRFRPPCIAAHYLHREGVVPQSSDCWYTHTSLDCARIRAIASDYGEGFSARPSRIGLDRPRAAHAKTRAKLRRARLHWWRLLGAASRIGDVGSPEVLDQHQVRTVVHVSWVEDRQPIGRNGQAQ